MSVLLMEPSAAARQRRLAGAMHRGRRVAAPDVGELKRRLQALRRHQVQNQDALTDGLVASLSRYPTVRVSRATTAADAVTVIQRLAGDAPVATNKSATLAREIVPSLLAAGTRILETYDEQFSGFEHCSGQPWQPPSLGPERALEVFAVVSDPVASRTEQVRRYGSRNVVAVLGVSAAGASDGTLVMVQHTANIRGAFEQCRRVVLVVGEDKIARNAEEALFVAKCMAAFGAEMLPLSVRGDRGKGRSMREYPLDVAPEETQSAIDVIILDNGRSVLREGRFGDLLQCIGCRACAKSCPTAPLFDKRTPATPRDYLFGSLTTDGSSLDWCLQCRTCQVNCPVDIDLPGLICEARAERAGGHVRGLRDSLFVHAERSARLAASAPRLANALASNRAARRIGEAVCGLSRERELPSLQQQSFAAWMRSRPTAPRRDHDGRRRVVYYAGCAANYYETAVAKATVQVLERNGFSVVVPEARCCGLPALSGGDSKSFRRLAEHNTRLLAVEEADIVTACSSCALVLEHDYPKLLGSPAARAVGERTSDIVDFLCELDDRGELDRSFRPVEQVVGYHTPCHLRALKAKPLERRLALLEAIPGVSVRRLERGCCGMAGTFGMKAKNSSASMAIGHGLFDAIRSASCQSVATECPTCTWQVRHGTGIRVAHPVTLVSEAYGIG